jgi:hypothetical protein
VCRKLNSAIVVMKAAKNRLGCDCSNALNSPMNRTILVQTPVGPHAIIVCGVLAKDPAQMSLSEHDQVVEAFPPDRADQPLRVPSHGEPGAVGLSRIPIARSRRLTAALQIPSRSLLRRNLS